MKQLLILIVANLMAFNVYAQMDHSGHSSHSGHKHHSSESKISLSHSDKIEMQAVLAANENLHNSFFQYDGAKVEENAKKLSNAISSLRNKKLAKLLTFSKSKLDSIVAKNDRELNNKNYNIVSVALLHVISKYDVGTKYKGYQCPMVKKKWIQDTSKGEKVLNPYAPEMPHCGSKL